MATSIRRRWRATLFLVAVVATAGCSALPTSPQSDVELRRSSSPGMWSEPNQPDPVVLPDEVGGGDSAPTPGPTPVPSAESSVVIYGKTGGLVSAGDFTVVIPPSAVSGAVTVTVNQPDVSKPVVTLRIWPSTKNSFDVPVTLVANASRLGSESLKRAVISWYNPATDKWEPMPSSVDLQACTVQSSLSHFSQYAVEVDGKAGW